MNHQDRQRQKLAELQKQWQDLSDRIEAVVQQLSVTTDAEHKWALSKRREALEAERDGLEPQIQRLEEVLEVSSSEEQLVTQVSESTEGLPPSPFGDMGRITDPDRFFDREELLRQIFERLDEGFNLSLVGESGIGKSSLLSMVCALGPKQIAQTPKVFAYLDLRLVDDENDFYSALCDLLELPNPVRGYGLARALAGRHIVLCIDYMEKMAWDSFTVCVQSQLRGLAEGHAAPLKLVIASRAPLPQLFPELPRNPSPLANICLKLDVPPFSREVAWSFIVHRLKSTSIAFTAVEIDGLVAESGGHPAKLQRAAAKLFRNYQKLAPAQLSDMQHTAAISAICGNLLQAREAEGISVIADYTSPEMPPDAISGLPSGLDEVLAELDGIATVTRSYLDFTSPVSKHLALLRVNEKLTVVTQQKDDMPEPFGSLLGQVVNHWRRVLEAAKGEPTRAYMFAPVPNPYVIASPVLGSLFVGREDILDRLTKLWAGREQGSSVVLYGHRRMGKSSILHNLGVHLDPSMVVVDFNMQLVGLVGSTSELPLQPSARNIRLTEYRIFNNFRIIGA